MMGGVIFGGSLFQTQVVSQGQPTQWGPNLTEAGDNHCATTLQDNSVILTGGETQSNRFGSARTEVYNSTTKRWERKADMRYRRTGHSCTNVWLDSDGSIGNYWSDYSILSVVVAGGKMLLYFTVQSFSQDTTMMRNGSSSPYTVWRCLCPGATPGGNSLPSLSWTQRRG